jgi:hypothetical protein
MSDIKLTMASWNKFLTRELIIHPDLVGAEHEFTHENCKVRIQLPSKKHLPKEPLEGKLLTFSVYREVDGQVIPSNFWVHAVDVVVCISEEVTVPEDILKQSPNAYEIIPKTQQHQLDEVAKAYTTIAEKAFDTWIRILRWKCDNSSIGRPEISDHESGSGTYLTTASAGQRIWVWQAPIPWEIGQEVVTPEIWNDANSALQVGIKPPVFVELMFDTMEHMKLGDLQRATVDMAVACECYLRMLVSNSFPAGINRSIREYLGDANIRSVLTRFVPEILDQKEKTQLEKIASKLHKLFDTRNDIVHTGRTTILKLVDCQQFLDATRKLFALRNLETHIKQ